MFFFPLRIELEEKFNLPLQEQIQLFPPSPSLSSALSKYQLFLSKQWMFLLLHGNVRKERRKRKFVGNMGSAEDHNSPFAFGRFIHWGGDVKNYQKSLVSFHARSLPSAAFRSAYAKGNVSPLIMRRTRFIPPLINNERRKEETFVHSPKNNIGLLHSIPNVLNL